MQKMHVVIADKDEYYLHGLVDYLTACYEQKFQVISFSEKTCLRDYLEHSDAVIDILLVGWEFWEGLSDRKNVRTLFVLQGERSLPPRFKDITIPKYQCGDKIVSQMLQMFSSRHPSSCYLPDGNKKTKVIAMYSPAGGTGKTTMAIGASIQSSWEGKTVFYLNLEEIPSTGLFLEGEQENSLSGVLYHLKHRSKDPAFLVETCRAIDPHYNIHYFKPPDSALDLKEEIAQELKTLVGLLCAAGQYDRIFIDMSSALDQNNLAVLEACDHILVIGGPEPTTVLKINALVHEFELLGWGKNLRFLDKASFILNRYEHSAAFEAENKGMGGKEIILKVPRIANLMVPCGNKYRLDLNSELGAVLHQLITWL